MLGPSPSAKSPGLGPGADPLAQAGGRSSAPAPVPALNSARASAQRRFPGAEAWPRL